MDIDIKNNKLGILLMLFVVLIIGILFLGVLADTIEPITTPLDIKAESVVITGGLFSTGQTANSNVTTITEMWNTSYEISSNLSTTLINWTTGGAISADNETVKAGTWFLNYTYTDPDYVNSSSSRIFINLIKIFFVIFLLAVGVAGFMKMKDGIF